MGLAACDPGPLLGAAPAEALRPAVVQHRPIRFEGDVQTSLGDERAGRLENEGKLCAEAAQKKVRVEGCAR